MSKWMLAGAACGAALAVGILQFKNAENPHARVVEGSASGLKSQPLQASASLRSRTAGVQCVLSSGVRSLPAEVQLRTAARLRVLPVLNQRRSGGRAVGEIVLPHGVLNEVDWAWEDLQLATVDGAIAHFEEDAATGACIASIPLARNAEPEEVRCPIAGGGLAPSVRGVQVGDSNLLPESWSAPIAAAEGGAFVLYDVPSTGSAELQFTDGPSLKVVWRDGVCAPVEVSVDAELCVHVPGGEHLHAEDRFEVVVGDTPVVLEDGVGCVQARIGETAVTQSWETEMGPVERTVKIDVADRGRQDTDLRPLPVPTEAGLFVWPTADGPRVVSVLHGVAEVAGVRSGDVLLSVDGVSTEHQPMHVALSGLDGSSSSVAVIVGRNDHEVEVTVMFGEEEEAQDTGL